MWNMPYHSSNSGYPGDDIDLRSAGNDDRSDGELQDKPTYLLEHLATFTVNKETGIVYPADGMRKLLQLEKTTGIWSQKMQLCLDQTWVLIMDYETGNIIERFPVSLIQEPKAFTSNDPMEMYNNILVFIVGGVGCSRSEMHIFQCQSISAVHLVKDLKQLRNGKMISSKQNNGESTLTSYRESIKHHRDLLNQQEAKEKQTSSTTKAQMPNPQLDYGVQDTDSEFGEIHDENSSTSSCEKYERDVTVLNHCFDDIEKFIARLQHSAAASRELERRRNNRTSKQKDPGEGLLTLRTRPPHEKEFIDIFSKFKLSFNLLAKLKAHIHDPNAPELVHFLFTPLALIVDASHDTYYDPNLPARVIKPSLTRDAINLLINCVTSKETELWRSLGDAWTIARDQWKTNGGAYPTFHPIFFDGWSPDYPVIDELIEPPIHESSISGHQQKTGNKRISIPDEPGVPQNEYIANFGQYNEAQMHHHNSGNSRNSALRGDYSGQSEISIDSIERNTGGTGRVEMSATDNVDSWLDDLLSRDAIIVEVTYPRTANNDKELTVVRGEYLEVMDDTRKWWKARNCQGHVAHVPHTILTPYIPHGKHAATSKDGAHLMREETVI